MNFFRVAPLIPVFLVATLTLTGCKTNEERAAAYFQSAQTYVQSGDFSRAGVEFRNAIRLAPGDAKVRIGFAEMLESEGNLAGAYQQYASLIEHDPKNFAAISAAARLAAELTDWKTADEQARAGLALKPDDVQLKAVEVAVNYANAVLSRDDAARTKAANTARELIKTLPRNLMLWRVSINDEMRSQRYDAALSEVDTALKFAPKNRTFYAMRLAILGALKDGPAIEAQLKQMVTLFPDDNAAQQTLLRWYVSQGKIQQAEDYLRTLAAAAKPDQRAKADLALVSFILQYRGHDAALTELDRVIASGDVPATPVQAAADDAKADKTDAGTDLTLESFRALKATILFQKGQKDKGLKMMEAIVKNAPPTDETRRIEVTLANMRFLAGDSVGARALVEKVLSEDKGQTEALKLKAGWLIDSGDTDEAISLLRTAVEANPNDTKAMTLMARAYERGGKPDLAGDMLGQAVEASNSAPEESLRYARFLAQQGKAIAAETVLIDALRLSPDNLQLLIPLGQVYVEMKDWPRAQGVTRRLNEIGSPEAKAAAQGLTPAILAGRQNMGAAIAYLEGVIKDGKGGIEAQVTVIRSLLAEGKVLQAKETADKLLAEKPDDPGRRFIVASVQAATGDMKGAEENYRKLVAADPTRDRVWVALIQLQRVSGQIEASNATLTEALKADPASAALRGVKAADDEAAGRIDAALAIYQKLYDENPNSVLNANNLASMLSAYRADDPKLLENAQRIARRLAGTKVPAFADTYGWIAYQRGNPQEALTYLELAAQGMPRSAMVQYHLAETYKALDQSGKATAQFEKMLAMVKPDDTRPFVEAARKTLAALKTSGDGAAAAEPASGSGN